MKRTNLIPFITIILIILQIKSFAQSDFNDLFRPSFGKFPVVYLDLDNDGDPDVLRTFINDSIPIQWIDDDDDMKQFDLEGDTDNDCLMIDRNIDGKYGGEFDLMIDWCDEDGDGKADLQIVADNAKLSDKNWGPGHFMISIDTDKDQIFNYINWKTLKLEPWDHSGQCRFFQDYSGKTMFLKIHTSTFNIEDLQYNWENPFLFYDPDKDGLSEMAIRLMDTPKIDTSKTISTSMTKRITDVRMSFDLDNDNQSGNEFDFDMSLKFTGNGFDYSKFVHKFKSLRGLPESDIFFLDPRWRKLDELIYVDHQNAYQTIFNEGKWVECSMVFDEDDDCQRWERVEFYEPNDVFKIGAGNGGLDNNPQADVTGDRTEWDLDNSGNGKLYIGKFDGRIHLLGAEWGAWRIDQNANYFQGWQGWRGGGTGIPNDGFDFEPTAIPLLKYSDTDDNGFFDQIEYDLDGDQQFEQIISLNALGINDQSLVFETKGMDYREYQKLFRKVAEEQWNRAQKSLKIAGKYGINTQWYSLLLNPKTLHEKYHNGYWLNYFIYLDLKRVAFINSKGNILKNLDRAYFSGEWDSL
jgi:hypothetical protein